MVPFSATSIQGARNSGGLGGGAARGQSDRLEQQHTALRQVKASLQHRLTVSGTPRGGGFCPARRAAGP